MSIRAFVVALFFIALGCSAARLGDRDEWSRPAPTELASRLYRANKKLAFPVASVARESAVAKLTSAPFVGLSLREAEDLVGQTLGGGEYFLVRGLCLGCGTGSFKVYYDGETVLVDHFSLAKSGTRPTRWPVVVSLEGKPEQIFVEYGAAQ